MKHYAWKVLKTGEIVQEVASSKKELFENAGFGGIRVNEPLKGYLAVEVTRNTKNVLVEVPKKK